MKTLKLLAIVIMSSTLMRPTHAVPTAVDNAWGKPQPISSAWSFGIGHNSATKIPDKTFWLMDKKRSNNAIDEAIVMVYAARQIVEHGGYFCTTQLRSRNEGRRGCPKIWTQYQNPNGDFEKTCFWLCEPGYSGNECKNSNSAPSGDECKYTKLSPDTLKKNISYNESGGLDNASVESIMRQNDHQGFFRFGHGNTKNGNEYDVILAAKSYLENGHGIVASPATFAAHGGMWNRDDYGDSWTDCKYGDSNLTITANSAGYKTKTLCMPGFSGPGCTTTACTVCDDELTKFNKTTGTCSDCIENHVHDQSGKCVPCPDGAVVIPDQDKCLTCKETEYIKDGTCAPRKKISKQQLYNCYPNSDNPTDFALCVQDTCTNGQTVKCMIDNVQQGTKTCTNKKWGACTLEETTETETTKGPRYSPLKRAKSS